MEEQGYIEIRIDNNDGSFSPEDLDISDINQIMSGIETFLYPTREEKKSRPKISYKIENGSAKNKFYLPISAVLFFNALTSEIEKRKSLDFLDHKRQEVIDFFQKKALKEGYSIEFNSSGGIAPTLKISAETDFVMSEVETYKSEFYLYGEIYQEGGKSPNIHISTERYGNLTVTATKEQIVSGEKKTYKPYGIKVSGEKNLHDGQLGNLKLLQFVAYRPKFDRSLLEKAIEKASANLSKIGDLDAWIYDLKADGA